MPISLEFLQPIDCSFHGIVHGSFNYALGRIAFDVCFGNKCNFRRENMEFEVMNWLSQYHAILERPAFSRFMAVPHYTYLILKMPGPNEIIPVNGSFKLSDTCDKEFHKMAQRFGMTAEYARLKNDAEHNTLSTFGRYPPDKAFNDTLDAKKIRVHPADPTEATSIESETPIA
jgi:hypothetical protein